jgi:hypothetical protein
VISLLEETEDRGYPSEYLISRIRARRSSLISDWSPLVYSGQPFEYLASFRYRGFLTERSPEGIWRDLAKEYRWVYVSMNRDLQKVFFPFFLYAELRTIFICLRHLKAGRVERTGSLLFTSLLSDDMKEILRDSVDVSRAVGKLERSFIFLSDSFSGIAEIFGKEGLKGFEREMVARYLALYAGDRTVTLMNRFFSLLIDARNIISLYKFVKLGPKDPPSFISQGSISEPEFNVMLKRGDIAGIERLAGIKYDGKGLKSLEIMLYRRITLFLKREGREPLGTGILLDYLWRCSIEAMDMSLLCNAGHVEKEMLMEELVH